MFFGSGNAAGHPLFVKSKRPRPRAATRIDHAGYVDIHSHILPGVDDGPRTLEESIELAREAAANGITDIVATPHLNADFISYDPVERHGARERLSQALAERSIGVTIHLGAEIRVAPNLLAILRGPDSPALAGGKYLLLEFSFADIPAFAEQVFFELQTAGYKPILAHPERNAQIQRDPRAVLAPMLEAGILMQINSTSLTGGLGSASRHTAIQMLERGWAHIMASDSHYPGERGPNFREAVTVAANYVGVEKAQALVRENPRRVIDGNRV